MRRIFFKAILLLCPLCGNSSELQENPVGYVSVILNGQFGNQLFEIATAYAYALDHNLALTVPDLVQRKKDGIPTNAKELFLKKIPSYDVPVRTELKWMEPTFNYTSIPFSYATELHGFFQSEKYFKHRRAEILNLFAPPCSLQSRILAKYPFLDSEAMVVGVQIRDYRKDSPLGWNHPTIGRKYYEDAFAEFPEDTIFIVSSNNPEHAKTCTQGLSDNIIYLSADYIEEFYTLVLCKSFIISNSSFGWWAAWLSTAPNKQVIAPSPWFALPYDNKSMTKDMLPKEWSIISYKKKNTYR